MTARGQYRAARVLYERLLAGPLTGPRRDVDTVHLALVASSGAPTADVPLHRQVAEFIEGLFDGRRAPAPLVLDGVRYPVSLAAGEAPAVLARWFERDFTPMRVLVLSRAGAGQRALQLALGAVNARGATGASWSHLAEELAAQGQWADAERARSEGQRRFPAHRFDAVRDLVAEGLASAGGAASPEWRAARLAGAWLRVGRVDRARAELDGVAASGAFEVLSARVEVELADRRPGAALALVQAALAASPQDARLTALAAQAQAAGAELDARLAAELALATPGTPLPP